MSQFSLCIFYYTLSRIEIAIKEEEEDEKKQRDCNRLEDWAVHAFKPSSISFDLCIVNIYI